MIELNFKTINENKFHDGLSKLTNFTGFSPKDAYHIGRIADKVGSHTLEARKLYGKLIEKYAKKDEKNKPIMKNSPPFFEMKDGTDMEAWNKEYEEFLDIKVSIDKYKIPLVTLPAGIGLSAQELKAIEPLLDLSEPEDNVIPIK